ncbi:SLOG family protein [Acutalibacter sp.]|uniref:SLOG family protein n=1 Tax=Acutalibacter sp. TaxID=1918636 RepID=UPI0021743CBD|nr:DUF1273 domain-containing protein [Acutalibacter sp.]
MAMKLIRERCCSFTGHRRVPGQDAQRLRRRLREEIVRREAGGIPVFLAGGALGFDTMAAQEVVRLRDGGLSALRLVLVLPGLGQTARWPEKNVADYLALQSAADDVFYTGDRCEPEAYLRRNRFLVDHSCQCLCYLTTHSRRSGTAYTVRYALGQGVEVCNLAQSSAWEPQV